MPSIFLDRLARAPILADGAMGTLLFQRGIAFDRCFDELNLTEPAVIEEVHRAYLAAGAELIETNTFGANPGRLAAHGLEEKSRIIARQGVKIARAAREIVGVNAFVAGSMGPLGKPLEPFGHLTVAEAERAFSAAAEGLLEGGCDLFILETFQDLNEILAALRTIRRVSADLPVVDYFPLPENTWFSPSRWLGQAARATLGLPAEGPIALDGLVSLWQVAG